VYTFTVAERKPLKSGAVVVVMNEKMKSFFKSPLFGRMLVNICIVAVLIAVYIAFDRKTGIHPLILGAAVIVLYIAAVILTECIYRYFRLKKSGVFEDEISPHLSALTLDFMVKLYMPVIISDENGRVIWHNRTIGAQTALESLYGLNISDLCGHGIDEIMSDPSNDGILAAVDNTFYRIRGYKISTKNKNYYVTVWQDVTELNAMCEKLRSEEIIVAYVMVDNLEELMQYVQEKYRDASSAIASVIKEWADEAGGILKEYERDKYLFVMTAEKLEEFIERKFDVLDSIRNIRVGESSLPVTVSVGIAQIEGTLAEREKAARASLDMALQRGGDQVVVKRAGGMDFYGGRTKSVQKRTKVRSRVVANELVMQISKSGNVLVMGHRNADFDSLGSCAGIARLAMFCGVRVNIICNTGDPNLKKCFDKLGTLPEYRDILVGASEALDLIRSDTLLIITDVNNKLQFEAPDVAENVESIVIIDHHRKTAEFSHPPIISYIEPSASSTCELISEILEQALPGGTLSKEEADIMFAGVLLDTKQFSRNTGVRTFGAALYLRNEGASPGDAQHLFKTNLEDFISEAKFESNVVLYRGVIAIAVNDSGTAGDRISAAKAADKLLTVDNVIAAFALCRIDDVIHVSARSPGTMNVQLVLEKLGGGGHFDSAGTQFEGSTMADALTRLKGAIDEYLSEN